VAVSREKLNLHLYESHTEAEIRAKYSKNLDQLLSKQSRERIRFVVLTQIALGKWNEHIERFIPLLLNRKISSIKYECAFDGEEDENNKKLREAKYDK
jgi:hypothetical protein